MQTRIPWNKGKKGLAVSSRKGTKGLFKHSEQTKQKMSAARKGKVISPEQREKIRAGRLARKARVGYLNSPATRQKLSEGRKGQKNWNFGTHRSEDTKRKIGAAQMGPNNHTWKGGSSFFPYSVDWTERLRRAIRERDRYTCQVCNREPAIDVHHIDYNKENCDPINLITLCRSCHMKTNHDREAWFNYFQFQHRQQAA